jgi:hypothetical protein
MKLTVVALGAVAIAIGSGLSPAAASPDDVASAHRKAAPTLVVRWNETTLEAVRRSRLGPPIVARALAIVHTCMYDAWAAYDRHAVGTRLGAGVPRVSGPWPTSAKR